MTTAAPEKTEQATVKFVSRSPDQILTRRKIRYIDDGFGGKIALTEEEVRNRAIEKGEEPDPTPWKVEFQNHMFETDNEGLIAWLRSHRNFNVINAPGGFYEEPPAPEDPAVAMADPMKRIAIATANEDVDALTQILAEEKAGANRPAIFEAAEAAIRVFAEEPPSPAADADQTGDGDPHGPDGTDGAA